MNILVSIFVLSLSQLLCLRQTTAGNPQLILKNSQKAPLALIRGENFKLTVAIPEDGGSYSSDLTFDLSKIDIKDFVLACPKPEKGNVLYPREDFDLETWNREQEMCDHKMVPTVFKINQTLTSSLDTHEIGYWVWNEITQETDFVAIYTSTVQAFEEKARFTTHTINSMSLLEATDGYFREINEGHYQLVPFFDFPIYSWRITTTLTNFNLVTLSNTEIEYLHFVDDYVKNSIVKMGKPITQHAGERSLGEGECRLIFRFLQHPTKQFGVVMVTLIAYSKKCSFSCYPVSSTDGWAFTPAPEKKIKLTNFLESIRNLLPKFSTFACKAEIGLLKSLNLPQPNSLEILQGPWPVPTDKSFWGFLKPFKSASKATNDKSSQSSLPAPKYFTLIVDEDNKG